MKKLAVATLSILWPLGAFAGGGAATLLVMNVLNAVGLRFSDASTMTRLAATSLSVAVTIFLIVVVPKEAGPQAIRKIPIGLQKPIGHYLLYAFLFLSGLLVLSYALDAVYPWLHLQLDSARNSPSFSSVSLADLLGNIAIAGALTAAVEEIMFRGYMFNGLRKVLAFVPSALITSAVFALMHFDPVYVPFLIIFSFSLCWLRERTQSIWPGMFVHMLFNVAVISIDFIR